MQHLKKIIIATLSFRSRVRFIHAVIEVAVGSSYKGLIIETNLLISQGVERQRLCQHYESMEMINGFTDTGCLAPMPAAVG
jgi:hypothetical protein